MNFLRNLGRKQLVSVALFLVLALSLPVVLFQLNRQQDIRQRASTSDTNNLYFNPRSGAYGIGQEITTKVKFNAGAKDITGADVTIVLGPSLDYVGYTLPTSGLTNVVIPATHNATTRSVRFVITRQATSTPITGSEVDLGLLKVKGNAQTQETATLKFDEYAEITARDVATAIPLTFTTAIFTIGNSEHSSVPVQVTGITTATDVAAGNAHTCARLADSTVKCWGFNDAGQLGNGNTTNSSTPVLVSGITTATQVAAGNAHTCARLADGTVKCWGFNDAGQLGNGNTTNSSTPVAVSGITTATQVATGNAHSCARLTDGTVKCWGFNDAGQLGNGNTTNSSTPVLVSGITTATQVAAGNAHTCARLTDGTVKCWGDNVFGQLGNGTRTNSLPPVAVSGITTATQVAARNVHACTRLTDSTIKCWGSNYSGQLGNGTTTDSSTPVAVSGITTATQVATGMAHACARFTDSTVKCWGFNDAGQLGNGTDNTTTPTPTLPAGTPTPDPSITSTPAPSPTPTGVLTPTPTPVLDPNDVGVRITYTLPGIGTNTSEGQNNKPNAFGRNTEIEVIDGDAILRKETVAFYINGKYEASVNLGPIPAKAYLVKIRTTNSLRKVVPEIVNLAKAVYTPTSTVELVTGDIDSARDNELNLADYSTMLDCTNSRVNCTPAIKSRADLNDDGLVDSIDLSMLYAGFARRKGD